MVLALDHDVIGLDARVSTVELRDIGLGVRFETLVFGGEHDGAYARTDDRDLARLQHGAFVRWLRGIGPMPEDVLW